ncbi:Acid phosphatase [Acidisarcina polymorpha]|uniref:Acid phosphatase n=1 Tax=Acidisarcina polymorpha TaxID=2211140 RepID=A0A2Z5FY25_9BACT|nr:alkaline phosphatase family protein [Acidisarcina polymorpha]AXC11414.1 Acid phosphatase [Acidisarcina polymorpha]
MQKFVACSLATVLVTGQFLAPIAAHATSTDYPTTTPIKHVVVIFQENVSFDHYFGTYPYATNPPGEPVFNPLPSTPTVNGLSTILKLHNPNLNPVNATGASNPFRLDRSQAATSDQDHDYTAEQQAFDHGMMDAFPAFTGTPGPPPAGLTTNGIVMGYYDGNTVTALWNYANHFAMNDNSYGTNFGPSTDGALNLISGQTNGVTEVNGAESAVVADGYGGLTLVSDADPTGDVCSSTSSNLAMGGKNIGDLLNAKGISWGFFEGGFDLTKTNSNGTTGCNRSTTSAITGVKKADYIPHHQPFQYYASTQNLKHTRPSSVATIGQSGDAANHQYDTHDFFDAVSAGNFPAVSFLKAPGYQDGHAGYSDPLDEQTFIVNTLNFLQQQPDWATTAVIIAYDDSDGWYDHQMSPIINPSVSPQDALTGLGTCGTGETALPGVNPAAVHAQGRCGYGPRLPFLVISPYAKQNFVDHSLIDQSSIMRFIERNWLDAESVGPGSFDGYAGTLNKMFFFFDQPPAPKLFLNPTTGEPVAHP